MEERKTFLDYAGQVFLIYGVTMSLLVILCTIFGDSAKEFSSMFRLGKEGLSISTMVQYFFLIILVVITDALFFTDVVIKHLSVVVRTICMFIAVVCLVVGFIIVFHWFPITMWQPWAMFAICFVISAGASTLICIVKEKQENRKMEEALKRLKNGGAGHE